MTSGTLVLGVLNVTPDSFSDGGRFASLDAATTRGSALVAQGAAGVEIALACQQVMGAYALSDAYDIDCNVRDLLGMPIVGGSSDMQKNNLARMWRL